MTMAQANGLARRHARTGRSAADCRDRGFSRDAGRADLRGDSAPGRAQRRRADHPQRGAAETDHRKDAGRGARFRAAAQLAEMAGDAQFFAVAERFKIASVTELPSLAALKQLVEDLESLANQQVA
jgi:hypothetical protein